MKDVFAVLGVAFTAACIVALHNDDTVSVPGGVFAVAAIAAWIRAELTGWYK